MKTAKIYIINLLDSSDRRLHMKKELKKLNIEYEFIDAVESKFLTQSYIDNINKNRTHYKDLTINEIACALSHIKAMKKGIADLTELIVIMEDDIILSRKLSDVINFINLNSCDDEITTLGNVIFEKVDFFMEEKIDEIFSFYQAKNYENLLGTQAYALTLKTATKLTSYLDPITTVADDWNKIIQSSVVNKIRTVIPYPTQHAEFFSTIFPANKEDLPIRTKINNFFYKNRIFPVYHLFLSYRRSIATKRHEANISINGKSINKIYHL